MASWMHAASCYDLGKHERWRQLLRGPEHSMFIQRSTWQECHQQHLVVSHYALFFVDWTGLGGKLPETSSNCQLKQTCQGANLMHARYIQVDMGRKQETIGCLQQFVPFQDENYIQ
jgi:hypothetical protein